MSLILVVEQQGHPVDDIRSALEAEGWQVKLAHDRAASDRVMAERAPDLVLVGGGIDGAEELLRDLSRGRGGPGVVAMVDAGMQHPAVADGVLDRPFTPQQLRVAVRRCLSKGQRQAAEAAAAAAASSGHQLTSEDLFGDMLAEVESMTESKPRAEPEPSVDEQVERKLEDTLSGILDVPKAKPKPKAEEPPAPAKKPPRIFKDQDVDDLLDETLSGLGVSRRRKQRPAPKAAPRSPSAPPPASEEEPRVEPPPEEALPPLPTLEPPEVTFDLEPIGGDAGAFATQRLRIVPPKLPEAEKPIPVVPGEDVPPEAPPEPLVDTAPDRGEEGVAVAELAPDSPPASPGDAIRPPAAIVEQAPEPGAEAMVGGESPTGTTPDPEVEVEVESKLPAEVEVVPEVEAVPEVEVVPEVEPVEPPVEASSDVVSEPVPIGAEADTPTFGQYTLLERIAVGGMAEVWKARMKGVEGFQKNVAIKKILSHLTDSVDFVTMFIDEAKLAAQLNHPNIIHIYDLGKIEDDYFIAMEYVEGKDLRSILNAARKSNRPLSPGLALLIASRLASALDYAHRKRGFDNRELGLVHRDVSPQNVLISYEGDTKLCDFGIVKAVAKASKTQMGALKGKLQYMSPEQAWGRVVDSRSDIFSLGSVLFEMLTGRRLFAGDSEISVLEAVRDCRVQSPRELDDSISPEVDAIVARALQNDPDDRYQTAGKMQKELEEALYELKPAPGQADLTEFMHELFGEEADTHRDESPEEEGAAVEPGPPETGAEVPAVPPRSELAESDESAAGKGWLIGLAAAVIVIGTAIAWLLSDREAVGPGPEIPELEATQTVATPVPQPPPAEGEPMTPAGEGEPTGETKEPEVEAPEVEEPEPAEATVESLVEDELRRREQELEAEKRRLERAIEAAAEEVAQSPDPAAAEPPPESEQPTPENLERELENGTADNESEIEPESTGPVEGEEVLDSEEMVEQPAPEPEPPEPLPSRVEVPEPEPKPPAVTPGQLVDLSTPGVVPPKLIGVRPPSYPPIAQRLRVEGTVVVGVLVDEHGQVVETRLVSGVQRKVGFNEAAISAAETATFEPATLDGVAVKVWYNLSVPFKL